MKTSLRRLRQMARVKTSLRRPCYLSKKKKKGKKGKNNKKKQGQQIHNVKLHAGCRCTMEERKPLNSQLRILIMLSGDLTNTSSKNTHFLQGMCTISSRLESSTGRCRLSTGRCRLSTGNATFLQEVLCFYRKLPVEVREGP